MDENALKMLIADVLFNKDQMQKRFDEFRKDYKGDPKEDILKLAEKHGMTEEEIFAVCYLAKVFDHGRRTKWVSETIFVLASYRQVKS